ncbi:hypothetical protein QA612_13735 [Evansella sp. AB-P1]|uniref:hypothetical protein n=1 Tax=Evansella sp. AB-P1 TaxID=3037653 RepID=UPI00241E7DA8|nr:hypothetical protein [Evansella sp. AB-P1]MDG5788543.1 hypothetical protein [Evansella sp. AB-P1]
MRLKIWIAGNLFIGVGAIVSFLYILFGLFWDNPHLVPWYPVFILVLFLVFNFYILKHQKISDWIVSLIIMLGSAVLTYFIHVLFVL